jgi:hypothetical protein
MKSESKLMLMALGVILSACGSNGKSGGAGGDSAMDGSGNCTQTVIDLHNSIVTKAKSYSTSKTNPSVESLKETQKSCKELSSLLDVRSCKAVISGSTEVTSVEYKKLEPFCSGVSQALTPSSSSSKQASESSSLEAPAAGGSSSAASVPAAAQETSSVSSTPSVVAVDSREILKLKNPVQLKVKESVMINSHLAAGIALYLQKGSSVSQQKLNVQDDLCWLERKDASLEVRDGDQIKMQTAKASEDVISIASEDQKVQLECLRLSGLSKPWTVQRLQEVLGSSVEVQVTE